MRIIGFDTGEKNNAWALLAPGEPVQCGMVTPDDADGYGAIEYALYYAFSRLITEKGPDIIAFEAIPGRFINKGVMGAIESSAIARVAAGKARIPVMLYNVSEIKKAFAMNGKAKKSDIRHVVKERFPELLIEPNEHECDAIAVGYTCGEGEGE